MITDQELLNSVLAARTAFGVTCGKFVGTVTVELLRRALLHVKLPVSERDVFIRGVPVEIDLLVVKPGTLAAGCVAFEPADVIAAFEVKNSGSFGDGTITRTKEVFSLIQKANPRIRCYYITLAERRGFKWAITPENIGHRAFTLFWHTGSGRNRKYDSTGDWKRFIEELADLSRDRTNDVLPLNP